MKTLIATLTTNLVAVAFSQTAFASLTQEIGYQDIQTQEQSAEDVTDRILFHCDFILKKEAVRGDFVEEANLNDPGTQFPYETQQLCAEALSGLTANDDIRPYLTDAGLDWYEDLITSPDEASLAEKAVHTRQSFFGRQKVRFEIDPADRPEIPSF